LDGGVLDRGAKEYRRELAPNGCASDRICDVFIGWCFLVYDHITHLIIYFCELLDEFRTFLLGKIEYRSWYFIGLNNLDAIDIPFVMSSAGKHFYYAPFLALVVNGLPPYEVYDTFELIFYADGYLHRGSRHPKFGSNLVYNTPRVCTGSYTLSNFTSGKRVRVRTCPFC
jgi:hypothetical protein